jgi:hydrogenase maturation protease
VLQVENRPRERILVVGVGNLLMGDDGVGIHAVRELANRKMPVGVDVIDGGTAGMDLLRLVEGYSKVLIIDAVDAGQEPGALLRFTPEDISTHAADFAVSLHQTEILKVMELATWMGQSLPPTVIYGVQPKEIDWSTGLSPAVQARLSSLVEAVLEEVSRWGRSKDTRRGGSS